MLGQYQPHMEGPVRIDGCPYRIGQFRNDGIRPRRSFLAELIHPAIGNEELILDVDVGLRRPDAVDHRVPDAGLMVSRPLRPGGLNYLPALRVGRLPVVVDVLVIVAPEFQFIPQLCRRGRTAYLHRGIAAAARLRIKQMLRPFRPVEPTRIHAWIEHIGTRAREAVPTQHEVQENVEGRWSLDFHGHVFPWLPRLPQGIEQSSAQWRLKSRQSP